MKALESEDSLAAFLRAFAEGTVPKKEWTHEAHLVMATCYLLEHPLEEATSRIRDGIQRYNLAVGGENTDTAGYHETLTIFWIGLLREALKEMDAEMDVGGTRIEKARAIAQRFGSQRDLFRKYYSFDVVQSVDARRRWVEPDVSDESFPRH
ncbi:MAG: hypothetical protein JJE04_25815 [Acidobacteriia bacterium]|nr:hypothetical protein [Terriglobia bacterium]